MFNRSRRKIILSIMGSLILLFAVTFSVILLSSRQEIRHNNNEMLKRYVELYALELQSEYAEDTEGQNTASSQESGQTPTVQPLPENTPPAPRQGQTPPDGTPPIPGEGQTPPDGTPPIPGEGQTPPDGNPPIPGEGQTPPDVAPPAPGQGQAPPEGEPGPMSGNVPLDRGPDYQLSTFYSVALAADGTVLAVDNGEKELYSEEDLVRAANEILAENKSSGKTGSLIYIVDVRPGYTLVAFMDNTVADSSMNTLSRHFMIVGGAAIAVLFFLSLFLSRRIIRPLEENDRRQKQFVSDASHELKTPVAVIDTNAEMLEREIGGNEWLNNIRYENNRMDGLVRQLLDLSRTENADARMESLDFSRIVRGEVLAFEALAFDRGKSIQSDVADGVTLTGNASQLTQLVSVLLDNAVRHSTGNEIRLSLRRQGHHIVLESANPGNEIPPEKLEHLFDRFYRVDEARGGGEPHYGLGLAIAKAVAENHGGSIAVACQNGWIRFTVIFP